MPDSDDLQASLTLLTDEDSLEAEWRGLEQAVVPSFFLSWHWIGTWLATTRDIPKHVFQLKHPERGTVALAILSHRTHHEPGVWHKRVWHLHESGDARRDQTVIEYNGLLCLEAFDSVAHAQFMRLMNSYRDHPTLGWDQLRLGGLEETTARRFQILWPVNRLYSDKMSWFADLQSLAGNDPIESLSRNSRSQIRQSLRFYGERGELALEHPTSDDERRILYDEMAALHRINFQHQGSGFDNPHFQAFHERLALGEDHRPVVDLIRCRAGEHVLGYLYNFQWQGRVLFYLGGLHYEESNRARPGLVIHYLAMQEAWQQGRAVYDFMAGDYRYKRSLCQKGTRIQTLILEQPRWHVRAERALRAVKSRLRR